MPTNLSVGRPADFVPFRPESILQGIHQRFEEQVRIHPENIAFKSRDLTHTYSELNGHANSVAQAILSQSGSGLAQAAILLPNSPETIVGMLGALKANKAYVPLDRNFPLERLRTMAQDAEPSVFLTDDSLLELAGELAQKGTPVINISRIDRSADAPNPRLDCDPLGRAYILYTSGTTGRPKGIVFLHRNLLHTTMCLTNQLFFSASDRVSWLHSASFAASVVDIYCCLANGGALYPWDVKVDGFRGMVDWFMGEKLTTLQWIPSAFRQLLRTVPDSHRFDSIRIVVMASEALTIREVDLFRQHFPAGSHLVNQVGTTESYNYYLYCVDHKITIEGASVPGGYPVSPDRKLLLLDEAGKPVPQGAIGEIAIKSDYMSGGYWRDEALTKAKFIRFHGDSADTYLTGDLGRLEQDGCLIHLGRKDSQIKLRGFRIEIAEVEQALTSAPGVADCVCRVAKNRAGEGQLVGYIVPRNQERFHQREVEQYLDARLPDYMVPRTYSILECLPTLPTGKVDREALPNPFEQVGARVIQDAVDLPHVERQIQRMFLEMLQLEQLSPETDFLSAGGDSLSAAVLQHRIQLCFGVDIPIGAFQGPLTPSRLAGVVARTLTGGKLQPIRVSGDQPNGLNSAAQFSLLPVAIKSDLTIEMPHPKPSVARQTCIAEQNLIIIGAGQLGREVFTWAAQAMLAGSPLRFKGFLDHSKSALDGYNYKPGILGNVDSYEVQEGDVFVSAIGSPRARAQCCCQIEAKGGRFVNIIHPLANIGLHVELGDGIVMAPFASLSSDVKVGSHVSIGACSNVGHDAVVGDWCQISSHCGLNGCGVLGDGVFLGSHACILPGVKVGAWSFVGAGSTVVYEVAERIKVFGNPAVPIGEEPNVQWKSA
jgi:sugar O-acyltransferase (sialic acid O-acetyltransferase NeuD family)